MTLGHELNPIQREYRRTIATAFNAALLPVVSSYVEGLETALREAGFEKELLIANCVGGMMPGRDIAKRPIFSVMSGPTLAPIAAKYLTREGDLIVADMGGTTFDISAVRDGQLIVTPEALIDFDMLGIPKIDVRSIGAGGGSIAWVDSGGMLKVGPQSAGAAPGPACYGRGGTLATVTDANVVLGIIDPDNFLGGRMKLERAAAERAVGAVADRLGIKLIEAAYAIHTTCNHNMVGAIENITVNEGIDPRESYLVSGGGATACHIAEMANVLGIKRFLVPKLSAALSAFGGLVSDLCFTEVATAQVDSVRFDLAVANELLIALAEKARSALGRAETPVAGVELQYSFLGRYKYQSWEIEVSFACPDGILSEADVPRLVQLFHEMHERIYGIREDGDIVEFTTWKVAALGKNRFGGVQLASSIKVTRGAVPTSPRRREVYFHGYGGLMDTPVFDGDGFGVGATFSGPCIVEEHTTTIILLPGMVATVLENGDYTVAVPEV